MPTTTPPDLDLVTLDQIERKLASIQAVMELLVALRIEEAGHAKSLREALAIARDPERAFDDG